MKKTVQCGNANLVWFGEEARGEQRVFGRFQAVGGALGHNNVHGHVAHRVQFLHREQAHPLHHVTQPTSERGPAAGVLQTSLVLASSTAWASFDCLMFSTIFLIKAWLLFSFLDMMISRMNHRALTTEAEGSDKSYCYFFFLSAVAK